MNNLTASGTGILLLVICVAFYFLPFCIALMRRADAAFGIFLMNTILGWTVLGWFGSLIWAYSSRQKIAKQE